MNDVTPLNKATLLPNMLLKLTMEHIKRIDEMLSDVGEYGEVHIIVQKGELKYINKVESYKLWKKEDGN